MILAIPHLSGEPAVVPHESFWSNLSEAMVKVAAKFTISKCIEPAAALTWARAFLDVESEWQSLPAPILKRLKDLYDSPINATWASDRKIHAIRRPIRAT